MPRGRPRKSLSLHLHEGTYKPDRHDIRAATEPAADGMPRCPRDLKGEARKFWERVVPQLVKMGIAKHPDRDALEQLSRLWAWWRAAAEEADADPTSQGIRMAVLGYSAEWARMAARFGLTPADRARIQVRPQKQKNTTEERYFG